MKKSTLISIKPNYANLLINGTKTVELRRKFPEDLSPGSKLFIYSSSPTQRVIGEVLIKEIKKMKISELWYHYSSEAMVPWVDFQEYFHGLEYGYAILVSSPRAYEIQIPLESLTDKVKRAPQSYCYLPSDSLIA